MKCRIFNISFCNENLTVRPTSPAGEQPHGATVSPAWRRRLTRTPRGPFVCRFVTLAEVTSSTPRATIVWLVVVAASSGCASLRPSSGPEPKNVIVLIAGGAGAAHFELARLASVHLRNGQPFATTDRVFRRGSLGVMTTHTRGGSSPDHAATATAMSTGTKTGSGLVAMSPDGERLAPVLQTAQLAGKRIGIVTTAALSDAAIAPFAVHAAPRHDHAAIVDAYVRLELDVLLGGGAEHFQSVGRRDGRDVVPELERRGYVAVRTSAELGRGAGDRLLGLFAPRDLGHEIDRVTTSEPSLGEMMEGALRILAREPGTGFVLLVSSEATDRAAHANDVAALIHDLWAFDRAVQLALAFQARAPQDTLVIIAGTHETGGLTPTLPGAARSAGVVAVGTEPLQLFSRITMSFNRAAEILGAKPTESSIDALMARHFPGFTLDPALRQAIHRQEPFDPAFPAPTQSALARMVARQTGLLWATPTHGAAPVVVGALGPGAERFRGWYDNTDFGRALHRIVRGPGRLSR